MTYEYLPIKNVHLTNINYYCGPNRTRTCDPLIMSQMLLTN